MQKFEALKTFLEGSIMKMNIGKTNLTVTARRNEMIKWGRYPCGVNGRGVGQNSMPCTIGKKNQATSLASFLCGCLTNEDYTIARFFLPIVLLANTSGMGGAQGCELKEPTQISGVLLALAMWCKWRKITTPYG